MDPDLAAYADEVLREVQASHPLPYAPKVEWRNYRVTAGMAYYRIGVIGLSRIVLTDRQRLRETLLHEYAHLLAVARHGRRAAGHGPAWKQAMLELGMEPNVRHTYSVERNTPRQKVTYRCLSCGKLLQRSRRLPRRKRYVHANCGGDLRLVKVERVTARNNDA